MKRSYRPLRYLLFLLGMMAAGLIILLVMQIVVGPETFKAHSIGFGSAGIAIVLTLTNIVEELAVKWLVRPDLDDA